MSGVDRRCFGGSGATDPEDGGRRPAWRRGRRGQNASERRAGRRGIGDQWSIELGFRGEGKRRGSGGYNDPRRGAQQTYESRRRSVSSGRAIYLHEASATCLSVPDNLPTLMMSSPPGPDD